MVWLIKRLLKIDIFNLEKYLVAHAYQLWLRLLVSCQTGAPPRVNCLALPPVCHMRMEMTVK